MRRIVAVALAGVIAAAVPAAGASAPPSDFAAAAYDILPPGESGDLRFPPTASDQLKLYDALTPKAGNVTARDLGRYFKAERFGVTGKVVRVETPRNGVKIQRDRWDVPHVYGATRADVEFGAGWATAEDRFVLLELLRGPGRIAAMDVPGVDPFALATSGRQFIPTAATEQRLQEQLALIGQAGAKGRQLLRDVQSYVAGINAYYAKQNVGLRPWTTNDVIAVGSLLGANLGVGGGDETRRSLFLDALIRRFGDERGTSIWRDLTERDDSTAPVSVDGRFPYDSLAAPAGGNVVLDDGSFQPSGGAAPLSYHYANPVAASNALLVSARRSATHHPLFVAGPQVGYGYPELLMELDLHGGGIDARGAAFPGLSFYVLLGRGKDFAWSATSANSDIVDHYAETLCGDDTHYLYQGVCRPMTTFDAGLLKGTATQPDRELVFRDTVHGPVLGYATVGGRRVAISSRRSTRGRELLSALAFQDLNTNRVHDVASFYRAMNQLEFTFNWFYADNRDIAMFSSGRLPIRAPDVASGLPTKGDGDHEWRGFEPLAVHVRGANPRSGVILNWNNKPGGGFSASDDNWSYGPVQRVQLLRNAVERRKTHTLASLTGAMNRAATQDLREVAVLPALMKLIDGSAPTPFDDQLLGLMSSWLSNGASRIDRDLDGKIDSPGAAIMDEAWPRIAAAVMRPGLGPLLPRLESLIPIDDPANPGGSSYFNGWYSYVVKDLASGFSSGRFCPPDSCAKAIWGAIDDAGQALAAEQGPDPSRWRSDATGERLRFGFLPLTARWTNRPTFQQVVTFASHRRR